MRILTLNYEFPPIGGGASPVSYELGRELVGQGHQIDLVTMGFNGLPSREVVEGIHVHRVPCLRKQAETCRSHEMASFVLAALPTVAKLVAAHRYDVNHTHFIVPTGLLARLLQFRARLPLVVTMHGSDVPGYNPDRFGLQHRVLRPLWKWILQGVDHVVSPSQFLRELADRHAPGLPITIIPNGFRYERFRADRTKERRILVVSRMLPRKGVQHLLTALPGVDLRGFEVDIVGDGPYLPTLRQMAAELGLSVKFWGWLDNASRELKELYERSSIFAFTSEAKNFPTVLLEAMAAGQAIITCDGTGCPEVVGSDALLVPPHRPDRLGEALGRLVENDQLRAELGSRARVRVQQFGWQAIARRHVELYHALSTTGTYSQRQFSQQMSSDHGNPQWLYGSRWGQWARAISMNSYQRSPTIRSIEPSNARSGEPVVERTSNGPRFARFVAAIEANPPQVQLLEELLPHTPSPLQSSPSEITSRIRRAIGAWPWLVECARSNPRLQWLGIGCWMLFCAAFFVTVLLLQDRANYDPEVNLAPDQIKDLATSSEVLEGANRSQAEGTPTTSDQLRSMDWQATSAVRPPLDASSEPPGAAEVRLEQADPLASKVNGQTPGGPPVPKLKPNVDHVAAAIPNSAAENR
jgi:glycosyltransferase involved in cell wall biosynthesis